MRPTARFFLRLLTALAAGLALPSLALATLVRIETDAGPLDIDLLDAQAPLTVTNFLKYISANRYVNSFFHRMTDINGNNTGWVLQGGGFTFVNGTVAAVTSFGNINNEFSSTRSNVRGTVAMAKTSDPNSANSQWFVNVDDNSAALDQVANSGGFTVFGRITAPSMGTIDRIRQLPVVNAGSPFNTLPLYQVPASGTIGAGDLVMVTGARRLLTTETSDSDRIFNYLEALFPQFIPLKDSVGGTALGYYFRAYPSKSAYLGTKDGNVYYLVPAVANEVKLLAPIDALLPMAKAAGY